MIFELLATERRGVESYLLNEGLEILFSIENLSLDFKEDLQTGHLNIQEENRT